MTITEFLLARIAEDEATVGTPDTHDERVKGIDWAEVGASSEVLIIGEGRVWAECQAKRAIIRWAQQWPLRPSSAGEGIAAEDTLLRHLAAVYADHPDYQQEWKP